MAKENENEKGITVKCDRCDGSGKISMNGVGRVVLGWFTVGLSEAIGTASTCDKCDGKGSVFLKDGDSYV